MYTKNKIETFYPACVCRYGPSRVLFILCLLCAINAAMPSVCLAADNHYIRDGASGDGSDWTNAWDDLPANLTRGDTYYVADGTYGSHIFNDPEDGEKYIYIKKAIESDHGTDIGWNTSYGNGTATFLMPLRTERLTFYMGYYILDGQIGGGPGNWDGGSTPFGFKITGPANKDFSSLVILVKIGNGSDNTYTPNYLQFKHIELTTIDYRPEYGEDYGFYHKILGQYQGDGSVNLGPNNITINHCYLHDMHIPIVNSNCEYWTVEYSLFARTKDNSDQGAYQSEAFETWGSDYMKFRYNIFQDVFGSGVLVMKQNNETVPDHDNIGWEIYGNIFWHTGDTPRQVDAGCIGTNSLSGTATTNFKIYNNSFVNINGLRSAAVFFESTTTSGNEVYNNIFVDCNSNAGAEDNFLAGVDQHNYNFYYNDTFGGINKDYYLSSLESHGLLGAADPFVNWQNRNFGLISPTTSGLALTHPNDVKIDMMGVTRGSDGVWDRGAIEHVSGSPDTTPPTIISVTVHSPVQILFSEPLDVDSATNISNYTIDPEIIIYSATLEENLRTVTLITSAHSINVEYTLTINGVKDVAGNTMINVIHIYQYILIANPGSDQTVTDTDGNGSEQIALDGSASIPDTAIVSWVWSEGATQIATGQQPTVILNVGTHNITLTVTDEYGATDTDTVTVTVNQAPTADAGIDQVLTDEDGNGSEPVTLNASGSDDRDGTIISYVWSKDANQIATGQQATVALNVGTHIITLTVTDDDGATDTDTVTVTVNPGNQAPTADAGTDQTLSDDDGNGSEPVTLDASGSGDWDGTITSYVWNKGASQIATGPQPTVALNVGKHIITLTVTDNDGATDTDTVIITVNAVDTTPPTVTDLKPHTDSIQVPLNTLVTLNIIDSGGGVDAGSVTVEVNGNVVYTGDTAKYSSASGQCYRTGTAADYEFIYQSSETFDFDQSVNISVNASDLAGNAMDEYSSSFQTEMRSFGKNIIVDSDDLTKGGPVTVRDGSGNIWIAWHAGSTGNKDIYISKLPSGSAAFDNSIKLTDNSADQRNPAIAAGSDDKLYVAWQDSRNGNWDIYMSTSIDGVNFSAETRVTDSNDNQMNPAIIVDRSLPNKAYIAWEDDRNGNQDIYVGVSNNGFISSTTSQITSELSYQGEPAIAVGSDNTVYIVWTDRRNSGENDIYGAASNNPWTNIPVVTQEDSQSSPAIAAEAVGSILHLVWLDDRPGNDDIYYAKTAGGLPTSPLSGSSIIDDTTSADQKLPVIAVAGSTGGNLRIYVCWQDERNGDDDLYLWDINSGSGTNILVGDDGTNTDQTGPTIGTDGQGQPYLVWVDGRNMNTDIYYAGSTFIEPVVLASGTISTSSAVTVGTPVNAIDNIDDVSVELPQGAFSCEIEISISKVKNPQINEEYLSIPYEFGPSGIEFDLPVTITIPYEFPDSDHSAKAYWRNTLTGLASQEGITEVERIKIGSKLYALRFKTTHFTQFFVGGGSSSSSISVSGGGGGGCSMSPDSNAGALELLLPYIGLTVAMVILKLRDRRKSKTCNKT